MVVIKLVEEIFTVAFSLADALSDPRPTTSFKKGLKLFVGLILAVPLVTLMKQIDNFNFHDIKPFMLVIQTVGYITSTMMSLLVVLKSFSLRKLGCHTLLVVKTQNC